ncbi:MAG TPA: hypothetical protein V6C65_26220 [Allocoleopsis sp.]
MRKIHENSIFAYEESKARLLPIKDQVLMLLSNNGQYTAKELCEIIGNVQTATMSGILRPLKNNGLVVEIGKKECPISGCPNSILTLRQNLNTTQRDEIADRIEKVAQ